MKRTLVRVYDRNDEYTNYHECYFLIMPDEYDINNNSHFDKYLLPCLAQVAGMGWQTYTSYIVGTAELEEDEEFWSEITNYEIKECKIHIDRVDIIGKYKLPSYLTDRH